MGSTAEPLRGTNPISASNQSLRIYSVFARPLSVVTLIATFQGNSSLVLCELDSSKVDRFEAP